MEKKNIALLYGGRGYEREISLSSAEFILSNIDREIFEPYRVFIAPDGDFFLDFEDGRVPCSLKLGGFLEFSGQSVKISAVFPALHGDFGEDGRIQGYLDCLGIPYVGCGTLAGALSSDKAVTKTLAERLGIPTAPFLLCRRGEEIKRRAELTLGYPMFVKPCSLGSSIGIFEVRDEKELDSALKNAHALCDRVILEEKIPVLYEVECAFFLLNFHSVDSGVNKLSEILGDGDARHIRCDAHIVVVGLRESDRDSFVLVFAQFHICFFLLHI